MRIAYLDTFAGISGDMMLGALLDAGVAEAHLREELAKLPLREFDLQVEPVKRHGIAATQVSVIAQEGHTHRHLQDVEAILQAGALSPPVLERSLQAFQLLAVAEARIHNTTPERIHFHEVGAVDAIVDIVGAMAGLALLGVEAVYASPVPLSRGWVQCQHGTFPLPAPATLELLKGVPTYGVEVEGELVTPTGAAILRAVARSFGPPPPLVIESVGYGAGAREFAFPNLLRLVVGSEA